MILVVDKELEKAINKGEILSIGKEIKQIEEKFDIRKNFDHIQLFEDNLIFNPPIGIDFSKSIEPILFLANYELLISLKSLPFLSNDRQYELESLIILLKKGKILDYQEKLGNFIPKSTYEKILNESGYNFTSILFKIFYFYFYFLYKSNQFNRELSNFIKNSKLYLQNVISGEFLHYDSKNVAINTSNQATNQFHQNILILNYFYWQLKSLKIPEIEGRKMKELKNQLDLFKFEGVLKIFQEMDFISGRKEIENLIQGNHSDNSKTVSNINGQFLNNFVIEIYAGFYFLILNN